MEKPLVPLPSCLSGWPLLGGGHTLYTATVSWRHSVLPGGGAQWAGRGVGHREWGWGRMVAISPEHAL